MGSRLSALIFLNCASILTTAPAASTRADSALSSASVAALASRLPLQEHRYALSSGVTPQAIYGNTVAWSVAVGPKCTAAPCTREADLYLANLAHFHPVLIRNVGHIGVLDVALSARWLVWLNGPYLRPGWWLWARDLRTAKTRLVGHSAVEGGPAVPSYPSIVLNGNELAWTREDCLRRCSAPGPSTVQTENLASGARRVLATNRDTCTPLTAVSITARAVTWTRAPLSGFGCAVTGTTTVIRLDRRTGTVTSRTVPVSGGNIAYSNGNYIIWGGSRSGTIHILNWRTGRIRLISQPGSSAPQINEDMAIWQIDNDSGLEALDLTTFRYVRLEHTMTIGNLTTVASGPHLGSRRRVIWEETQFPSAGASFKDWLVVADVPGRR
jgi:hypothetical protein